MSPPILCGEKVGKRGMVISQPILISPLPLPPVSCWRETLKLLDGRLGNWLLWEGDSAIRMNKENF